MEDKVREAVFILKYDSVKELMDYEVIPFTASLIDLSYAALNFANAAVGIASIKVTETHEIEELMDQVFEIRHIAEKIIKTAEPRVESAMNAIKTGAFETKCIEPNKKQTEETQTTNLEETNIYSEP